MPSFSLHIQLPTYHCFLKSNLVKLCLIYMSKVFASYVRIFTVVAYMVHKLKISGSNPS